MAENLKVQFSNTQILKIALPIFVSISLPQISLLTNIAFLGHYNEFDTGINGIGGVFYIMLTSVAIGLNGGLQAVFSRRAGQMEKLEIGKLVVNGLYISSLFLLFELLFTLLFDTYILKSMLSSKEVIEAAVRFIDLRVWGLPFNFISGVLTAFLISTNHAKYILYVAVITELISIISHYALIFGNFGFPAFGLMGAAYASIISEAANCLLLIFIIYLNRIYKEYITVPNIRINYSTIKNILTVSTPLIIQYIINMACWFSFFLFIEHLGGRALAISNVMRSILGICGAFIWSFASTCNTMVSNFIGQELQYRVIPIIKRISLMSIGCMVILGVLFLLSHELLLNVYSSDKQFIKDALPSLVVVFMAAILMSVGAVCINGIVGVGSTKVNLTIEIVSTAIYFAYVYLVINHFKMPLVYAWGSEIIYWLITLVLSVLYLSTDRWKTKMI